MYVVRFYADVDDNDDDEEVVNDPMKLYDR